MIIILCKSFCKKQYRQFSQNILRSKNHYIWFSQVSLTQSGRVPVKSLYDSGESRVQIPYETNNYLLETKVFNKYEVKYTVTTTEKSMIEQLI